MRFVAHVEVSLKPGLLDPQGKAIEGSLPALGWSNVSDVRVGKYVRLSLDAQDRDAAAAQVDEMSRRLLSNPVIEDVVIREVVEESGVRVEPR
jgi:phosphoribosylformylglycinamidine synthase PurS subunit